MDGATIITIVAIGVPQLGFFILSYLSIKDRLMKLETKVDTLTQNGILTRINKLDTRISHIEGRLED